MVLVNEALCIVYNNRLLSGTNYTRTLPNDFTGTVNVFELYADWGGFKLNNVQDEIKSTEYVNQFNSSSIALQ